MTALLTAQLGPLDEARAQLADAVEILGLDEGVAAMLAVPRREMTVAVPLRRDDGSITTFISPIRVAVMKRMRKAGRL